jgi:hypothetical protein
LFHRLGFRRPFFYVPGIPICHNNSDPEHTTKLDILTIADNAPGLQIPGGFSYLFNSKWRDWPVPAVARIIDIYIVGGLVCAYMIYAN